MSDPIIRNVKAPMADDDAELDLACSVVELVETHFGEIMEPREIERVFDYLHDRYGSRTQDRFWGEE
jgi:hypothetical protein